MSMQKVCDCNIREAGGFNGWDDFAKYSAQVIDSGGFKEVPVKKPYSDVGLIEKWYECSKCGNLWRLVEPDPPFKGNWSKAC